MCACVCVCGGVEWGSGHKGLECLMFRALSHPPQPRTRTHTTTRTRTTHHTHTPTTHTRVAPVRRSETSIISKIAVGELRLFIDQWGVTGVHVCYAHVTAAEIRSSQKRTQVTFVNTLHMGSPPLILWLLRSHSTWYPGTLGTLIPVPGRLLRRQTDKQANRCNNVLETGKRSQNICTGNREKIKILRARKNQIACNMDANAFKCICSF